MTTTDTDMTTTTVAERRYTQEDLNVPKPMLVKMVQRQLDKWPHRTFNPSKTKVTELKAGLLKAGFTKEVQVAEAVGGSAPVEPGLRGELLETAELVCTTPQPTRPTITIPQAASHHLTDALKKLEGCQIELVIEDWRVQKEILGTILTVSITPVRAHPNGELDIDANEFLRKIQQSPASISGRVKLSFHDPVNAGYQRYFVKMNQPDIPLQDVPTSPDVLTIPSSRKFKMIVEHADDSGSQHHETVSASKRHMSEELSLLSDSERPLEKARRRADKHDKNRSKDEQRAEEDAKKRDIEWLRGQASTRPGYDEFCANRNRKLTNPERIKFWAFAASFSADYYGNFSGAQGQTDRRIKKKSVLAALGLGTTALAEAVKATKIINTFSKGARRSQEVVNLLEKDEVQGSSRLLDFLLEWHKKHPAPTNLAYSI